MTPSQLSEYYDQLAERILLAAVRAGRNHASFAIWIASPAHEFRPGALRADPRGYTAHERELVRAVYRAVSWRVTGTAQYSLKAPEVTAGPVPSARGTRARRLRFRVYPRELARVNPAASYIDNPALRSDAAIGRQAEAG